MLHAYLEAAGERRAGGCVDRRRQSPVGRWDASGQGGRQGQGQAGRAGGQSQRLAGP